MFFMSIEKAKFRRLVVPGDILALEVVPLRKGSSIWKLRGEAKVDEVVAAEAEFVVGIKAMDTPSGASP
jgi:3-hydroxyacyl-[acyl-carrier-protein] dehydratase